MEFKNLIKKVTDLCEGISETKNGYEPRNNSANGVKDLFVGFYSIVAR
jgi:hypothetical protein